MSYRDKRNTKLDISCSGRGMQQTMLLLAYLISNPNSVLILDEPDAHLEILRQRQIYQVLSEWAQKYNGQIVAASHSEVVLNEAAGRDVVIAFLGKAHRIDRGSQLSKALKEIGYDQYFQAEQRGWVLYVEGSTDLAILRELAIKSDHPAAELLSQPFVKYVGNIPKQTLSHFFGLREAKPDLLGIAIYDKLETDVESKPGLRQVMWKKNEIENYICLPDALYSWAQNFGTKQFGDLFKQSAHNAMEESIESVGKALETLGKSPWSDKLKTSDEFLEPLFNKFFVKLKLPNTMQKSSYYKLASHVPKSKIHQDVKEVLDIISEVAKKAKPKTNDDQT